jgi:hypothetical protein
MPPTSRAVMDGSANEIAEGKAEEPCFGVIFNNLT